VVFVLKEYETHATSKAEEGSASMKKLWITGITSIALVSVLTIMGSAASDQSAARFFVLIAALTALMVLVGKGHRWARWPVSAVLVFIAVTAVLAGGLVGVAVAALFGVTAVVFFRHRSAVH
jgi:hypothetical protein